MATFWLTVYILIWPVLSAAVLYVICKGVVDDLQASRREGRDVV